MYSVINLASISVSSSYLCLALKATYKEPSAYSFRFLLKRKSIEECPN